MYKIAIVEDERPIANMYRMKFKRAGYNVRVAYDGQQGLALLEEFIPDLLLLDLRMPELNGDKLLEHVRQSDWGGDMRVVVLTNISRDEAPPNLRLLNIDRYVVKAHTTPSQVLAIAESILR